MNFIFCVLCSRLRCNRAGPLMSASLTLSGCVVVADSKRPPLLCVHCLTTCGLHSGRYVRHLVTLTAQAPPSVARKPDRNNGDNGSEACSALTYSASKFAWSPPPYVQELWPWWQQKPRPASGCFFYSPDTGPCCIKPSGCWPLTSGKQPDKASRDSPSLTLAGWRRMSNTMTSWCPNWSQKCIQ